MKSLSANIIHSPQNDGSIHYDITVEASIRKEFNFPISQRKAVAELKIIERDNHYLITELTGHSIHRLFGRGITIPRTFVSGMPELYQGFFPRVGVELSRGLTQWDRNGRCCGWIDINTWLVWQCPSEVACGYIATGNPFTGMGVTNTNLRVCTWNFDEDEWEKFPLMPEDGSSCPTSAELKNRILKARKSK